MVCFSDLNHKVFVYEKVSESELDVGQKAKVCVMHLRCRTVEINYLQLLHVTS